MATKPDSGTPPGSKDDLAPGDFEHIRLDTLADVERELARVYKNMRMKKCTISEGNGLVQALFSLGKVKRENVADELLRRLEAIEQKQAKAEEQAKAH